MIELNGNGNGDGNEATIIAAELAEEKRLLDIEKARLEEEARLAEEARLEEEARLAAPMANASPLPSLPSISNVGAVPFTGTVSNIPGGFQPLPQTAGQRKKLYQLSKFHGGINRQSSPRDIADFECQEATNLTVSSIGRIKLLGDIKDSTESITFTTVDVTDRGSAGYGLFQFTAPASADATAGEFVITLASDGTRVDADDSEGPTSAFMSLYQGTGSDYGDGSGGDDVAIVYYAAGNGVYANNANFTQTTSERKARVYVSRDDINGTVAVSGWSSSTGLPLIASPTFHASNAEGVELKASHGNAGAAQRLEVAIADQNTGECSICGKELESGFICLDGGEEFCSDHIIFVDKF